MEDGWTTLKNLEKHVINDGCIDPMPIELPQQVPQAEASWDVCAPSGPRKWIPAAQTTGKRVNKVGNKGKTYKMVI